MEQITTSLNETIGYSGKVKLYKVTNGKTQSINNFHNEGKLDLFRFLAYCVSGKYSVAEEYRPYKIIACDANGKNITYGAAIISESTAPVVNNGSISATVKAMIPALRLAGRAIKKLCLCNKQFNLAVHDTVTDGTSAVCAVFELDTALELQPDESLRIEWTLSFENKENKTNNVESN